MLESAEAKIEPAWLSHRAVATSYVEAVFEPAGRMPAALRGRLSTVAAFIERELSTADELWAWRRPDSTVGGLAVVRGGAVVRAWKLKT